MILGFGFEFYVQNPACSRLEMSGNLFLGPGNGLFLFPFFFKSVHGVDICFREHAAPGGAAREPKLRLLLFQTQTYFISDQKPARKLNLLETFTERGHM